MIPRIQAPSTAKIVTADTRLTNTRDDLWLQSTEPVFRFEYVDGAATDRIRIGKYRTNGLDEQLTIPFRIVDSGGVFKTLFIHSAETWDADISNSGIDTTLRVGGRIDGIAAAANTDYLIWAFYDPSLGSNGFKGLGITKRPRETGVTVTGGTLGSSTTFTVAAGRGYTFPVGCRILAREGTAIANDYNQGVVTAHTSTTVVATLDATYGAIGEPNAAIATPVELMQLDKFQPRITASDSLYPGSGTEYAFTYIGHIQSDASSAIRYSRKRGDLYQHFDTNTHIMVNLAASTGASGQVSMRRWLGAHVLYPTIEVLARNDGVIAVGNEVQGVVGADSVRNTNVRTSNSTATFSFEIAQMACRSRDTSFYHQIVRTVTATASWLVTLPGYIETEF